MSTVKPSTTRQRSTKAAAHSKMIAQHDVIDIDIDFGINNGRSLTPTVLARGSLQTQHLAYFTQDTGKKKHTAETKNCCQRIISARPPRQSHGKKVRWQTQRPHKFQFSPLDKFCFKSDSAHTSKRDITQQQAAVNLHPSVNHHVNQFTRSASPKPLQCLQSRCAVCRYHSFISGCTIFQAGSHVKTREVGTYVGRRNFNSVGRSSALSCWPSTRSLELVEGADDADDDDAAAMSVVGELCTQIH